ncbi:hypothetical protein FRB96_001092 [Tulasnella sp. 330]|nr:hypothetical protein FRB96_001092 [Tulasnella sp. 330]
MDFDEEDDQPELYDSIRESSHSANHTAPIGERDEIKMPGGFSFASIEKAAQVQADSATKFPITISSQFSSAETSLRAILSTPTPYVTPTAETFSFPRSQAIPFAASPTPGADEPEDDTYGGYAYNQSTSMSDDSREERRSRDPLNWNDAWNDPESSQASPTRDRRETLATSPPSFASNALFDALPFPVSEEAEEGESPDHITSAFQQSRSPKEPLSSAYSASPFPPTAGPSTQPNRSNTGAGRSPRDDSYLDHPTGLPPTSHESGSLLAAGPPPPPQRHYTGTERTRQDDSYLGHQTRIPPTSPYGSSVSTAGPPPPSQRRYAGAESSPRDDPYLDYQTVPPPTSPYSSSLPAAGPPPPPQRHYTGAERSPQEDSYPDYQTGLPPTSPYNPFLPNAGPLPLSRKRGTERSPRYNSYAGQRPRLRSESPSSAYSAFPPAAGPPLSRTDTGQSRSSQLPRDIRFTIGSRRFRGFSNYSLHGVHFEGKIYPTAEHLFQALKAIMVTVTENGFLLTSSLSTARISQNKFEQCQLDRKMHSPKLIDCVKMRDMDRILRLKFQQHDDIREELLFTGNARLLNDTANTFWGIGPNNDGQNELGLALMRLRTHFAVSLPDPGHQPVPFPLGSRRNNNGPGFSNISTPHRRRTGRTSGASPMSMYGNVPGGTPTPPARAPGGPTCKIASCPHPPFQAGSKYCNNKHRKQAVTDGLEPACILCKEYPKSFRHFCGQKCAQEAEKKAPMVLPIPLKDPKFDEIVTQFTKSWRHQNKTLPTVRLIYKIVQTNKLMEDYNAYLQKVESEGNFTRKGRSAGNECRRWHGTRRACNIGDDPQNLKLCAAGNCALCSIIRNSFQVALTGAAGRSFNRFGRGVYTSSTSSKSHDYVVNHGTSLFNAMLLTTVVVGRGHKLTQDSTQLLAPPQGFHSVIGEKGGSLNFDEV